MSMSFLQDDITQFTEVLSSKAAVPGGGGASALVGAVGASLASMVGNLTVGKKKYAEVEDDVYALMDKAEAIRVELLRLIDADAEAFEPLSRAYGIPKEDPERPAIMERALKDACGVPMDIMRTVARAIEVHEAMGQIGSALAISDVGVGVVCCKAALKGASLNVYINTKSMADREYALALEAEADELMAVYCAKADEVFDAVMARLRG